MTSTPAADGKRTSIAPEALLDWLEQQDELEYLRHHAGRTLCEYRPQEATSSLRIQATGGDSLPQKQGVLHRFTEQIWVPAKNMRGKAYATPELDKTINSVAKLMCIGTLWDFFTTIPIFQFSLSGPLTVLSLPAATVLSFILLISSNYAGENSTNKSRGNGWMANVSLSAFLILCVTKTLFSGVGIDLWVGSRAIASKYAAELAATKLEDDRAALAKLEAGGTDYEAAKQECDSLEKQMNALDRNTEEKKFTSLYVKARGTFVQQQSFAGLNDQEILAKSGSLANIPVCPRAALLLESAKREATPLRESIKTKTQLINQMPALAYLEKQEPDLYREHFKVVNSELLWVNGTEAVGQATRQFYDSLFKGEFGLLGFSLFSLAVSVILTLATAVMLYVISLNLKMKASFTGGLQQYLQSRMSAYEEAVDDLLKADHPTAGSEASPPPVIADEESSYETERLQWLINNAQAPEDRVFAQRMYQERLFKLWRKHVASTGETYYPPLANDLFDRYKVLEEKA